MTTETDIEKEIVAKGCTAPRLTPADIDKTIVGEIYFNASDAARAVGIGNVSGDGPMAAADVSAASVLTICILILRNGFLITGESACASPENYDAEIGRKIARENARSKIWALEGYLLRSSIAG